MSDQTKFTDLDRRLHAFILASMEPDTGRSEPPKRTTEPPSAVSVQADSPCGSVLGSSEDAPDFGDLALEVFALQFAHVEAYRVWCRAKGMGPDTVRDWREIPAMPVSAYKEYELSSIPPALRTCVFHSSGTTGQLPSQHWHHEASLGLYHASLLPWFRAHCLPELSLETDQPSSSKAPKTFLALTPSPTGAPRSSLVHMFNVAGRAFGSGGVAFLGEVDAQNGWQLDTNSAGAAIEAACEGGEAVFLLGTAFSFVHLLDSLLERRLRYSLPQGSRVLETGGYKGRSRTVPRSDLHCWIGERLGVAASHVVGEYGMSELSSQAYDGTIVEVQAQRGQRSATPTGAMRSDPVAGPDGSRVFRFPPWIRAQVISMETGREAEPGEIGLLRIWDLANLYSVSVVQTEDLAIATERGFELRGRCAAAEPRGCSLASAAANVQDSRVQIGNQLAGPSGKPSGHLGSVLGKGTCRHDPADPA